jgi:hypothetical protein
MRTFVTAEKYVIFLQLMAACGHQPSSKAGKGKLSSRLFGGASHEPSLELYPVAVLSINKWPARRKIYRGRVTGCRGSGLPD